MCSTIESLGPVDRIPLGEGRSYKVGGETVAVFRPRSGGVYAVQADCPHKGGPLVDGLVAGAEVVCPLHGFTFDLASGAPTRHAKGCAALRVFPVTVSATGELQIELGRPLEKTG
jgi:nitrite reductase (NADH) small subunit